MKSNNKILAYTTAIFLTVFAFMGCKASSSPAAAVTTTSGSSGSGGAGGTFTGAELNGTWTSACRTFTGVGGATYYQNAITISGGNSYTLVQDTFTNANCNLGGYGIAQWTTGGSFTVGGVVSGDMQSIQFSITSFTLVPFQGGATWFQNHSSNDVALYGAPTTITDGYYYNYFFSNATVNGIFTPNPTIDYDVVNNVATYDGTTLTLGVGQETIAGAFANGTTPTTATIAYAYSP